MLITAQKVERELKSAVRFNPTELLGVDYPLDTALEVVGELLNALEDVKWSAAYAVQALPAKVQGFRRMIEVFVSALGAVAR